MVRWWTKLDPITQTTVTVYKLGFEPKALIKNNLVNVYRTVEMYGVVRPVDPKSSAARSGLHAVIGCYARVCRDTMPRGCNKIYKESFRGATHGDLGRQKPAPRTNIMPASWRVFDGAAHFLVLNQYIAGPMTCEC